MGASALILAMSSAIAPAWGSSKAAHKSSSTLEFAIFHDYSGPNAAYGPEAAAGCFPAERIINAAGGVLGHPVTCVPTDAKGDPADAVPAANRLIASTSALVGVLGGGSDDATAIVPLFQQAGIPIFSTTGEASFDHSTASYFWRILSPDSAQGAAMSAAAKKLGFTKVATVFGNDSSAQGSAPAAILGVGKIHLKLVANQTIAIGQLSYRSEVQKLVSSKPQAIISEADPQTSATYFSELAQLGTVPSLITDPVSQEPNWRTAVIGAIGKSTLNSKDYAVVAYEPANAPAYKAYTGALKASAKKVPQPLQWESDPYSVADYDSVVIMALAMDMAHSSSPKVYNRYITKVTNPSAGAVVVHTYAAGKKALAQGKHIQYAGASGAIIFDRWHNAGQGFAIERYKNGNWHIISRLSAAEIKAAI
ncbi:MAG TPA: ABC transporter substrate-binding protein [Acidimicrobiales bacterium]|nr:ABC transporter substrate-binding protein [Acidimicrobiales bacterium]